MFLIFFLCVLLYGGLSSTSYSLQYGERSATAWRPYLWPIKIIMCIGIFLMLLQAVAEFFKDIARIRGVELVAAGEGRPASIEDRRHDRGSVCRGRGSPLMSYEMIAILMFSTMMLMLLTGQRVFGAIGFVGVAAALLLWGTGGSEIGFSAAMKLMKWYPLLTLPMFIFMGYVLSESRIADDLYKMFHVWMGPVRGGLAIGTIGLMVLISAMNGLSVAGMAIGATIALPELLKRGYDKRMVTGVIQAGSSLGILVPPSVVLVLYAMIARQPVGQLWLAGVLPGLMMAAMFVLYIAIRCRLQPELGPALPPEDRDISMAEKLRLLRAGLLPLAIFAVMMVPFVNGWTSAWWKARRSAH